MFDPSHALRASVAAALVAAASACSGGGTRAHAIDDVRAVAGPLPPAPRASSAARFGFDGGGSRAAADPHDHGGADAPPTLHWTLPAGWEELPPTATRQANFRVGGGERAECSLTVLPGGAGGLVANVDRWCGQMGVAPLGEEGVARLEHRTLLGAPARLVDLAGDYRGMGAEPLTDARLLGLVAERGSSTFFLKLVGPAPLVERERAAFEALAASFVLASPAPVAAAGAHGSQSSAPASSGGLAWDTPEGWTRGPERSMRLVTFVPARAPEVECYVTVLPGRAGGAHANVDRWRGQVGLGPLDAAGWEALPRVPLLGVDAPLVELEGDFVGMGGTAQAGAALFGAIADLGGETLFVKMTGPADAVRAERPRFLELCASLRRAEGP